MLDDVPASQPGDEEQESLLSPTSETHREEIKSRAKQAFKAFLLYSLASEVFAVVSQGLFLPIALEQYARDNGTLSPDHVEPCNLTESGPARSEELRCDTHLFGRYIDSSAFALWTFSAAVALQAIVVILLGREADKPTFRRQLLAVAALGGSLASIVFFLLPSSSSFWWGSALLAILANLGFGLGMVALNAYLPGIGRGLAANEDEPLSVSQSTARVSARGIATGYLGGCLVLTLCLVPVLLTHGTTLGMRIAVGGAGVWWLVLALAAVGLMPATIYSHGQSKGPSKEDAHGIFLRSWHDLWQMLRQMGRLPQAFLYLLAWLLLSDAFTTVTSTAILFGKTVLHMKPDQLIIVGILTPAAGIAGAMLMPSIARRLDLSNLQTLIRLVASAAIVPLYGCLGLLPSMQRQGFGGLTAPWEMYLVAVYFGAIYGAFQSFSRAVFSSLIPANQSARWFGLYSITDKSASFLGPAIVGAIVDATGSLRAAFIYLVIALVMPIPILAFCIDAERGRQDAQRYAREEA